MQRYVIIQKLGWGHFSTVWLAKDQKFDTYVALKVQKSSQHYLDAAYDEVEILQELERFNKLTSTMFRSLTTLKRVSNGLFWS